MGISASQLIQQSKDQQLIKDISFLFDELAREKKRSFLAEVLKNSVHPTEKLLGHQKYITVNATGYEKIEEVKQLDHEFIHFLGTKFKTVFQKEIQSLFSQKRQKISYLIFLDERNNGVYRIDYLFYILEFKSKEFKEKIQNIILLDYTFKLIDEKQIGNVEKRGFIQMNFPEISKEEKQIKAHSINSNLDWLDQ